MNQVLPDNLLLLGKVIRPHGLDGLLRIQSYAISEAALLDSERIFLRSASGKICQEKVTAVKPHQNLFLMKLEGISSISQAQKYKGAKIFIEKETLTCDEGEYFFYELIGLEVYLDSGEYVGKIVHIISAGSNDIYVVKEKKKEILIPATYEIVKEVEVDKGRITISAMEGLLNLNEI